MTDKNTDQEQVFDPLDMNNYKVEKLPKMEKSGFEKWMARQVGRRPQDLLHQYSFPTSARRPDRVSSFQNSHVARRGYSSQ